MRTVWVSFDTVGRDCLDAAAESGAEIVGVVTLPGPVDPSRSGQCSFDEVAARFDAALIETRDVNALETLNAILQSQFKFGADAALSIATIGAGISGGTTAALRADVVSVAKSRGLYAGVSLEGSILARRNEENAAYYGRPVSVEQIVLTMEAHNPGSDNLRAALIRWAQEQPQ